MNAKTITQTEARTAYTAGLRKLADILDANPDLPLPYTSHATELLWIETINDGKAPAAMFARLVPGKVDKNVTGNRLELTGQIEGLKVAMLLNRDDVCERVVTGTHEVTEEIPDPEALAAVPKVTQTRTEEIVEWHCGSLLGGAS